MGTNKGIELGTPMQRRRRYPTSRIDRHGTGYKWRMRVPDDVFQLYGRRYFIATLPNASAGDAQKEAARLDMQHYALIDRLRATPASDRAALVAGGGTKDLAKMAAGLLRADTFMTAVASTMPADDGTAPDPVQDAIEQARFRRVAAETRRQSAAINRLGTKASPGITTLVPLYASTAAPRNVKTVEKMELYAQRFEAIVGTMPPSAITANHVRKFRDALEQTHSPENIARHLSSLHTLFSIAVSEGKMQSNPARDVRAHKPKQSFASMKAAKKKPLSPADVHNIFEAMKSLPLQDQWVIKLCVYHGARSGEIVQLEKNDIQTAHGVTFMRLHDDDNGRGIKNVHSVRDVPLHPACHDFIAFVAAQKGPNVFDYPNWKGGKASAFQHSTNRYLRSVGALPRDDHKISLHSARHYWRDLAREAGMPQDVSRSITGHRLGRDTHDAGYGQGPSLKSRLEWLAKIDPLA